MANEVHLQIIQNVIARLAGQSTATKGWAITLTGALAGLGVAQSQPLLGIIAAYVISAFAGLDAYFLALERLYRALFDQAASGTIAEWSMDIGKPSINDVGKALVSPVSVLLYGMSLAAVIVVTVILAAS